ncbi:TIGR01458 family HAD-type hydrolase [Ruegeria arenilitoris]|uniref:TIGR01458 family HAD-type hydrolase n=1 Tax=Ruegeria arenilitoris TaxID=1173585 RepID=UPI001C2BA09A|nr:TIGR01458 family HAD-type hydrolase [Ruegeria arenilitoris]
MQGTMAKVVLLDIAGVLYDGDHLIDGALCAVSQLRESKLPIRFLTNSTRQPKRLIFEKLAAFKITNDKSEIITPAEVACVWPRQKGYSPHLLVHPDLIEDFLETPSGRPVAVVVGDAGLHFTYERLNAAFRILMDGAPLIALAANRVFRDSDGELSMDVGAFVKALEYSSAKSAFLLGKPSPDFFLAGAHSMNLELSEVVMIGDDAESDISGALVAGAAAGILTQTGKYHPGDENRFDPGPTLLVADVAEAVGSVLTKVP